MTDSRYQPRDAAVDPWKFGRPEPMSWLPPAELVARVWSDLAVARRGKRSISPLDAAAGRIGAAQLQHHYSQRIRAALKFRGIKLTTYADKSGNSYDRIAKVLRGEVILRLDDLAMADRILGPISEVAVMSARRAAADVATLRP